MSVAGILYLRKIQPNTPRPIKVNLFYPYSFLIICLLIIAVSLYQKPIESILCFFVIGLGIPVFWLGVKWQKPKSVQNKFGIINCFYFCKYYFAKINLI
jgi:hypothetical protein